MELVITGMKLILKYWLLNIFVRRVFIIWLEYLYLAFNTLFWPICIPDMKQHGAQSHMGIRVHPAGGNGSYMLFQISYSSL
jgi:hypothetical protein